MATQHGQGEGIAAGVEHPLAGRDHHHGQLDMKWHPDAQHGRNNLRKMNHGLAVLFCCTFCSDCASEKE
jgi:hypothetical protein